LYDEAIDQLQGLEKKLPKITTQGFLISLEELRAQAVATTKDLDPIFDLAAATLPPEPPRFHPMHRAWEGLSHEALRVEFKRRRQRAGADVPGTFIKKLSQADRTPPPPLILNRLDPSNASLLFGPGDIGKGTLASYWITGLQRLGHRILLLDYESHEEEWARRIWGLEGDAALADTTHVSPSREWGGAIWDHTAEIIELVLAEGITFLIVDSAGMACGGLDPSKPDAPLQFGTALQQIGLPSLTLAHVTKAHDARYPYGSVYWHNVPRMSWSLMPKGPDRILVCRKANNYEKPAASAVTFTYQDRVLREVWERPADWTLEDRIAEVLADPQPRTPTEIAAILNDGVEKAEATSSHSVSGTLSRGLKRAGTDSRFTVTQGGRWSLRGEPL
jgi:hypothetical protein